MCVFGNILDECGECGGNNSTCEGCTDPNATNYDEDALVDDNSCTYPYLGDMNNDEVYNVMDIILVINFILDDGYVDYGDLNQDGYMNVLDVIILINWILDGETPLHEEFYDDGTAESNWYPAASNNWAAVKYSAVNAGEEVMSFKWYQIGDGGAMYTKVFADDNGMPGEELYSGVTTGGVDGWNDKDLSTADLVVSGDFWVGVKTFATTLPMGVDTNSNTGNSMTNDGDGWAVYDGVDGQGGNIMFRVVLD